MAILVAQAGTKLYIVDPDDGTSEELTLPDGVTLSETRRPRFAALNRWVVMTHSPSENIAVAPSGDTFILTLTAPSTAPTLTAGGTGLNGRYGYKVSFAYQSTTDDSIGVESKLGPAVYVADLTDDGVNLSSVPTSGTTPPSGYRMIRRLYRTTSDGELFYHLADIEDNTTTTYQDRKIDAELALVPSEASVLVDPPGSSASNTNMKVLVAWRNRLWGVSDSGPLVDTIFYTDNGSISKWGNSLISHPAGYDEAGVVAMVARRDELLVLKRTGVWQITGTGNANFSIVQVAGGRGGCIAPESVVVVNDIVYWLGKDGVYQYAAGGVECLTDGSVRPWFTKDVVFNRARFENAFARYNELRDQYELHLAAAGTSAENRWVSYSRSIGKWFGPHKTAAFTPVSACQALDGDGLPKSVIGGTDGFIYVANSATKTDGASSAIDFDCEGGFHHGDNPDIEHHWGQMSVLTKVEAAGTLQVIPTVGRLNSLPSKAMAHDLTTGRELLEHVGDGPMCRLRFRNAQVGQDVALFGYDLPHHDTGRR